MFFAKAGEYEACKLFTRGHLGLFILTIFGIILALKLTKNKKNIQKIIRRCTIFVWIFEFIIIFFKVSTGGWSNVNNYLPLYYCSILLYAGAMSSFAKGHFKRIGDVFLATGGIVGGVFFMLYPITSLATYPVFHLVSFHSFIFHGIMIYIGVLINLAHYVELNKNDIIYYFSIVSIIATIAYVVNQIFDSNLMFISKNFPGNIVINFLYNTTGKWFALVMMLGQAILPFYLIYGIKKVNKQKDKEIKETVLCN